jgi:uncharacterized ferritin-like protein (DUF455 family)
MTAPGTADDAVPSRAPDPTDPWTIEAWCETLIRATTVPGKIDPPPPPKAFASPAPHPRRLDGPGRPAGWVVAAEGARTPKPGGLADPTAKARLLHTFFHHELQAAELLAWAVLAFPETPEPFRRGLIALCLDELRHARLYAEEIRRAGHELGDFPVRDWFWERIPACPDASAFVATLGLGFEGGNLEHTRTFAARFRAVGDERGARLQERIGREEVAHVRFAHRWFLALTGLPELDFDVWRTALPPPLSPMLMHGRPLARDARRRAGQPAAFLDELDAWTPTSAPPGTRPPAAGS